MVQRQLGDRTYRLEPLFADDFADTDNWRCEGVGARMWTEDGWLLCDSREGDVHAATIWCTAREFADPLWIEFDVRFLDGRYNGNLFVHARHADGTDVLSTSQQRTGDYGEYHTFPNYILTFLNEGDAVRIRYRRDPGFELLGETYYQPALERNRPYRVTILLDRGHVQYWVDGAKRFEGTDSTGESYTSGRIGLRTWRTMLGWANLRVYRVAE